MISSPDLTPEQRRKLARAYRTQAIVWFVLGVMMLGTGIAGFARGRSAIWNDVGIVFGIIWFAFGFLNWSRARSTVKS